MAKITDGFDFLKNINIPNFEMPRLEPFSITPPTFSLPDITTDFRTNNLYSMLEEMETSNYVREIDTLQNELEWQNTELEDLRIKLSSLSNVIDMKLSLGIFIIVALIGVVIPFAFVIFSSNFDNAIGKTFLTVYLCISFAISLLIMFIYIFYSYKISSPRNNKIKSFRLYTGNDKNVRNFRLYKNTISK